MTATQKVSRSRKRPARTPPSTFLFLSIHLSNNPGPLKSRLRYAPEPPKPVHPTWPYDHGRMLDHRENSEGLVDAPSRRAAARQDAIYRLWLPALSTVSPRKCSLWTAAQSASERLGKPLGIRLRIQWVRRALRHSPVNTAALEPHSSAVLAHSCRERRNPGNASFRFA